MRPLLLLNVLGGLVFALFMTIAVVSGRQELRGVQQQQQQGRHKVDIKEEDTTTAALSSSSSSSSFLDRTKEFFFLSLPISSSTSSDDKQQQNQNRELQRPGSFFQSIDGGSTDVGTPSRKLFRFVVSVGPTDTRSYQKSNGCTDPFTATSTNGRCDPNTDPSSDVRTDSERITDRTHSRTTNRSKREYLRDGNERYPSFARWDI
jgi:hypothetical protein